MSRAKYSNWSQSVGNGAIVPVPSTQVTVYEPGTTTPIGQTLFAGPTGGTTLANPFTTDSVGLFEFWLATPQDVNIAIGAGTTAYERVLPSASEIARKTVAETVVNWVLNSPTINTPLGDIVTPAGVMTLTGKTLDAPSILNWIDGGKFLHFDIRKMGAVSGGTDCKSSLEQAAGEAFASSTTKKVYIPPGTWYSSYIDWRNLHSIEVYGQGTGISILQPLFSAVAGHHFVDINGAGGIVLRDFEISTASLDAVNKPLSMLHYGVGAGTGNAARFQRLDVYGLTTQGTFCNTGTASNGAPSSKAENCFFRTYGNNAPAMNMAGTTNWTFDHCEFHELEAFWNDPTAPYTGTSNSQGIILNNVDDLVFIGATMGGNSSLGIQFDGTVRRIVLLGPEIYAQDPVGVPFNVIFQNNGAVEELTCIGTRIDARSQIFGGAAGAVYRQVKYATKKNSGSAGALIAATNGLTIEDSEFDCSGMSVDVDGAGSGTIRRSKFWNIGGLTCTTKAGILTTDTNGHLANYGADLKPRRVVSNGTPMTSGQFALTGWGTSPPVSGVGGTDLAGELTITAASGLAASPITAMTFKDGAFASAPHCIVQLIGTDDTAARGAPILVSRTTTALQWQTFFTPTAGKIYTFSWMVVG